MYRRSIEIEDTIEDTILSVLEIPKVETVLVDVNTVKVTDNGETVFLKLNNSVANYVSKCTSFKTLKSSTEVYATHNDEWKSILSDNPDDNIIHLDKLLKATPDTPAYLIVMNNSEVVNITFDYYSIEEVFNTIDSLDKVKVYPKYYKKTPVVVGTKYFSTADGNTLIALFEYYLSSDYVTAYLMTTEGQYRGTIYDNTTVSRRSRYTNDLMTIEFIKDTYSDYQVYSNKLYNNKLSIKELLLFIKKISNNKYATLEENYVEDVLSDEYTVVENIFSKLSTLDPAFKLLDDKQLMSKLIITEVLDGDIKSLLNYKESEVLEEYNNTLSEESEEYNYTLSEESAKMLFYYLSIDKELLTKIDYDKDVIANIASITSWKNLSV